MTPLGPCRHLFSGKVRCGVPLAMTPFGPGHVSRPRWHHYPTVGPVPQGVPGPAVDAEADRPVVVGLPGARSKGRGLRRSLQRLARLEACPAIKPFHAGDELTVCGNCQFGVYRLSDGSWRHSPNEIRATRSMAAQRWPR